MRLFCTLFSLGLAVIPLSASEIEQRRAEETGKKYKVYETAKGEVYKDATVTKVTDAGITVMHAEGVARLRYEDLSAEQQKEFGITKEGAQAVYAKERKAAAAYEAQVAAIQKKRQEERQKALETHQALVAQQTAELQELERLEAERLAAQPVQAPQAQADTTIVSVLEVPEFPVIRGTNNEVFRPILRYSGPQRNTYYRNSTYTYPVYRGGTYGYPSRGAYYHPGYHHGYPAPRAHCPTYHRPSINITIK